MATVPIFGPDGLVDVPYEQLQEARAHGGKIGVRVKDPQGVIRIVPADQMTEATSAENRGQLLPYEEQAPESHEGSWWNAALEDALAIPQGLMGSLPPIQAYRSIEHSIANYHSLRDTGKTIEQTENEQLKNEGYGPLYRWLTRHVAQGVAGVNAPAMEESARQGDPGGVLGHAIVPAALATAPMAVEGAARIPGVKTAASVIREVANPENIGTAVGGYLGYEAGHYAGGAAGAAAGRAVGKVLGKRMGTRAEPAVFPGAPYPEDPGTFPGAPYPEDPGVFPGAPEPTGTPEQINPSLVSPARTLPGQVPPELTPEGQELVWRAEREPQPIAQRESLALPPAPETIGSAAGARADTDFFGQARAQLGEDAPLSKVVELAQDFKMGRSTPGAAEAPAAASFEEEAPRIPSGESIPRTLSGDAALRQILTGQDNANLMKIAKSRGINVTRESQLRPGFADNLLINKIISDFSEPELQNIRDTFLESKRNRHQFGDIGPEAWKTMSLQTYFPEVKIPFAAELRTRMAIDRAGQPPGPGAGLELGTKADLGKAIKQARGARPKTKTTVPAAPTAAAEADLTDILEQSLANAQRTRVPRTRGTIPTEAGNAQQPGRNAGTGQTIPEPNQPSAATAPGSETNVKVPGEDRSYAARYQVRELADVQPSHNGLTFQPNENYHLTNDRDYSNKLNQGKIAVNSASGQFDPAYHITDNPDATNGPIVVDSEGHALGGNGRAMILQRVYKGNAEGAAAYRALLEKKAAQFGLDPATVAQMKEPVLVREIADRELDPAAKQAAITDFNKKGTAELTPAERAVADSRRVSQDTLDNIAGRIEHEGEAGTLADVLKGQGGTQILDRLIEDGVLTPQERAAYASQNALTEAGQERIRKLMVARYFRDPAQVDSTPAGIRNKVESIAAPLARVDGVAGWDLTPHIQEALDLLEEARTHGTKNLDDLLAQQGLFGESRYSQEALTLAKHLQSTPAKALANAVRAYATDAADAQRPMFAEGAAKPEQAFRDAFAQEGEQSRPFVGPESSKTYGKQNKIVSEADAAAARKNLRNKLFRSNMGLDPTAIADAVKLGAYHVEAGVREFAAWSKQMIDELGPEIRPHLAAVWEQVKPFELTSPEPDAPMFYSKAAKVIDEKVGGSAPGDSILATLRNAGVKAQEIEWTGLDDFLAGKAKVSKAELQQFMKENEIRLEETSLGHDVTGKREMEELLQKQLNARTAFKDMARNELREKMGISPTAAQDHADHLVQRIDFYGAREGLTDHLAAFQIEPSPELIRSAHDFYDALKDLQHAHRSSELNATASAKYEDYTLPGEKSNYTEMLLKLPDTEPELAGLRGRYGEAEEARALHIFAGRPVPGDVEIRFLDAQQALRKAEAQTPARFKGGHFNEPNILAHVRFDDRISPDGKKTLFIEEVQSDWHQQGKKQGYAKPIDTSKWTAEPVGKSAEFQPYDQWVEDQPWFPGTISQKANPRALALYEEAKQRSNAWRDNAYLVRFNDAANNSFTKHASSPEDAIAQQAQIENQAAASGKVPDAPFKSDWHELAMKRMLRHAAENGYDRIAWTTGEQQAARYDLSKHIGRLEYDPETQELTAWDPGGSEVLSERHVSDSELPDYIGKEAAEKLQRQIHNWSPWSEPDYDIVHDGEDGYVLMNGDGEEVDSSTSMRELERTRDQMIQDDQQYWESENTKPGLDGLDLKVGGDWAKALYDRAIPNFLNKYTKKWGGKVGKTEINTPRADYVVEEAPDRSGWLVRNVRDGSIVYETETLGGAERIKEKFFKDPPAGTPVHSLDITPAMKKSVLKEGQPISKQQKQDLFEPELASA